MGLLALRGLGLGLEGLEGLEFLPLILLESRGLDRRGRGHSSDGLLGGHLNRHARGGEGGGEGCVAAGHHSGTLGPLRARAARVGCEERDEVTLRPQLDLDPVGPAPIPDPAGVSRRVGDAAVAPDPPRAGVGPLRAGEPRNSLEADLEVVALGLAEGG